MSAYMKGKLIAFGAIGMIVLVGNVTKSAARADMDPVKAVVGTVDRSCTFVSEKGGESKTDYCGDSASLTSDPKIFKDGKRIASVKGSAKVSLMYTAPNGSSQSGSTDVSANDDLYYTLKAGDEVAILVDRKDPTRFILDK